MRRRSRAGGGPAKAQRRKMWRVIGHSTFDLAGRARTLVGTAARLCHADSASIHRRKSESSDFLRALDQRDRAWKIAQPDVNMEGRCDEQLLQP
jgi:hypothetical protein